MPSHETAAMIVYIIVVMTAIIDGIGANRIFSAFALIALATLLMIEHAPR